MEDDTAADEIQSESKWRYLRPRPLNYYLKTTRARRKIGSIATKGFFQIKEFLKKEIPMPSPKEVTGLVSKPFSRQSVSSESTKDKSRKKQTEDELDNDVRQSNEILAEATTVFPFTLFPDTVTVDRTKLTITQRTFFMTSKVLTIHIEDVLNLTVNVGPLFGSLKIAIKGLTSEDHFSINYFWRKDAIHLKHVIQGHIIAQHNKLEYKKMEREKLIETLIELGRDSHSKN